METVLRPEQVQKQVKIKNWLPRYWLLLTLALLTFVALGVRLYLLDAPIGGDEIWQYYSSAYPLRLIIPRLWPDHSPLFFFFSHFMLVVTNYSHDVVWLRLPAVLFGVASIPAIYLLAHEIVKNLKVALLTTAIAVFAPVLVNLSQTYRMYSLLILLAILSTYCLLHALRTNFWLSWVGFVLLAVANLYNHYNAVFILFEQGVFVAVWFTINLVFILKPSRYKIFDTTLKFDAKQLGQRVAILLGCFVIIVGLYLPWLSHLFNFINTPGYGVNRGDGRTALDFITIFAFIIKLGFGYTWASWVAVPVATLGLGWLLYQRFFYGLFCLCFASTMLLIIVALPLGENLLTNGRYYSFIVPVYLLLVAQGLAALTVIVRHLSANQKHLKKLTFVPATLMLAFLIYQSLPTTNSESAVPQSRLNAAAKSLKAQLQPDDVILTLLPRELDLSSFFQLKLKFSLSDNRSQEEKLPAYFVGVDRIVPFTKLQNSQNSQGRVWLAVLMSPWPDPKPNILTTQIQQAAQTDFVTECDYELCIIGLNSQDVAKPSNQHEAIMRLLNRFKFLNPNLVESAQTLAALNLNASRLVALQTPDQINLTEQPFYIALPIHTEQQKAYYYVKFKYKGSPSRIFVGLQDKKGNNTDILPNWDGYAPPPTTINSAQWSEDGLIFAAAPNTDHAILTLLGELGPAQIKDVQLFQLDT